MVDIPIYLYCRGGFIHVRYQALVLPGACSLAPHVLLHEIRVPFDAVETSVAKAANLTEEFARINPKKRVPVLSLDGEVITEVPAIATAIANLAPERHLMGRTALDRVRVYG